MIKHPENIQRILDLNESFVNLNQTLKSLCIENGEILKFKKGAPVFSSGETPKGLFAVLTGSVSLFSKGKENHKIILGVISRSVWFGETELFHSKPYLYSAACNESTTLLHIQQERAANLVRSNHDLVNIMASFAAEKFRVVLKKHARMRVRNAKEKLVLELLNLSKNYGASFNSTRNRILKINHTDLADMLFLTRQTVSRLLKELKLAGLISCSYANIEILDFSALEKIVYK